jgi:hypothetical protein
MMTLDMLIGSGVRSAHNCNFLIRQVKRLGSALFDQRQCLEGFGRRAQVGNQVRVAAASNQVAVGISNCQCAQVDRFNQRPPGKFYQ